MLATMIVLCLASAVPGQPPETQVLYQSPSVQVHQELDRIDRNEVLKNYLMYNGTYLGNNYLKANGAIDYRRYATTYFHRKGPVGLAFEQFNWFPGPSHTYWADVRLPCSLVGLSMVGPLGQLAAAWSEPPVAVLGIGAGTPTSYARPFQTFHLFERIPEFVRFSDPANEKKAPYFHFVRDARKRGALVRFFEGEMRPTFEKSGSEKFYHLIQVETYKVASSTVLKELLTREGIAMLMSKLADDGVLCFHTSNRYHDLVTTVASAAEELGLHSLEGRDLHYPHSDLSRFGSTWIMVARQARVLDDLAKRTIPDSPRNDPERPIWIRETWRDQRHVWRDGAENPFVKLDLNRPVDRSKLSPDNTPQRTGTTFKGVNTEVRTQPDQVAGERKWLNMLMFHGINIGTNYHKPADPALHGKRDYDWSRLPTTYYHPKGPVGLALRRFNWFGDEIRIESADARLPCSFVGLGTVGPFAQAAALWSEPPVAVLGMATATLAAYARPMQTMHFTERIPDFVKLSMPSGTEAPMFHYLGDAGKRGAAISVFEGEPRATFAKHGADKFYRLIVVETYKEAVRTVHTDLMTREGMQMLMSKLAEDGVLCYHTSNRYYDLAPVIASAADRLGYACLLGLDQHNGSKDPGHYTSSWVMVARREESLQPLQRLVPAGYAEQAKTNAADPLPYWSNIDSKKSRWLWTDQGEIALRGLYRSDPGIGDLINRTYDLDSFLQNNSLDRTQARAIPELLRGLLREIDRKVVASKNK